MTNTRNIAADALFMVLYIGFAAGMTCLSVALVLLLSLQVPFGTMHITAASLNVAGWLMMPFFPAIYRAIVGQRFSWRSNSVLDGCAEA